MKKTKSLLLLLLVIINALVSSGCMKSDPLIKNVHTELKGNPQIKILKSSIKAELNNDDNVKLHFTDTNLKSNDFYNVQIITKKEDSIIAEIIGGKNDINSKSVSTKFDSKKNEINKIVKTDENGRCDFTVDIKGSGDFKIKSVNISSASQCQDYKIYQSDDKTVRIIFNSKDVKNSGCQDEVIINWLNNLSTVRKTLRQFSDNGLKTVDYCAVNQFEHYGLSGNPIYINSKYVVEDLKSVKDNKTEILWRYVHEMAHYADGYGSGKIASRVFDSELSAQLECAYALTVNNFKYSNGKTAVEYFAKNTNLANGVYSDESFLLKLFRIFEEVDPKLRGLKQAFLSDKYKSDMSEYEKLTVFLNEISNAVGINIYDFFTNKEIRAVTNKFLIQ